MGAPCSSRFEIGGGRADHGANVITVMEQMKMFDTPEHVSCRAPQEGWHATIESGADTEVKDGFEGVDGWMEGMGGNGCWTDG